MHALDDEGLGVGQVAMQRDLVARRQLEENLIGLAERICPWSAMAAMTAFFNLPSR
jgi:hypothetical protein